MSSSSTTVREIHGHAVRGVAVDAETRCAHWHGTTDIIALRMKCCLEWFPCYECHAGLADHAAQRWTLEERDTGAILCGACGLVLNIQDYMACDSRCPGCDSAFNPSCTDHYHLYFELT
jgi:uncharacterized CHY-type Zn-finger protein